MPFPKRSLEKSCSLQICRPNFAKSECDRNQRSGFFLYFADFYGWNSCGFQVAHQICRMFGRYGDQQASGGLGIEQDCFQLVRNSFFVSCDTFRKIAVVVQAAGDVASANAVECAFEDWDLIYVE